MTRLCSVALALVAMASPLWAQPAKPRPPLTDDTAAPVGDNQNSRTAGVDGPATLDNLHLLQKLARFDRERIPERVVHARGVGAHGEFVCYDDLSKLTKAKLFSAKDKTTPVFVRFSTVIGSKGSSEAVRDPRGFSVKFYTDEGNWDLVGNNMPVFFIRDAIKFPDLIHSLKPNPINNQQEPARFFDFLSHVPESTHMLTFLYSDIGTPASHRMQDGFGVHAFKFVNAAGEVTYVKFNWRTMQGLKYNNAAQAGAIAAQTSENLTDDLYSAINQGKFPSWELGIQLLKKADFEKMDFDPLDDTKIWPDVPETKVGKLTLNKIPSNFFQFTEQSAFSPAVLVPGIEASEDKMLQGRLFSYGDTQRHRLGVNYLDLPVNKPRAAVANDNQDGQMNTLITKGDVNYEPSRRQPQPRQTEADKFIGQPLSGIVAQQRIAKTQNFQQAGALYRSFDKTMQDDLVANVVGDLKKTDDKQVQLRIVSFFYQADATYGSRVAEGLKLSVDDVKKMIDLNKDVEPTQWKPLG